MNSTNSASLPTILMISADFNVARGCREELSVFGGHYRTVVVSSVEQAHARFLHTRPSVVFLDESAIAHPVSRRSNPPSRC
jgi:hypothetical protein